MRLLNVSDWRRAGRPYELVTPDEGATFTRSGGGVAIRAETATQPPDLGALSCQETAAGRWRVSAGRYAVGAWNGSRGKRRSRLAPQAALNPPTPSRQRSKPARRAQNYRRSNV